ncbi:MAG: hypothetical protein ACR2GQ_05005 [Gemmatimonadota bacterium]
MNETAAEVRRAIEILDLGIVTPAEGAFLRRLNSRLNGDADPRIRKFARTSDPFPHPQQRDGSPFDERDLELTAAEVTKREAHRELQGTIWTREKEYARERRRRLAVAEEDPAKLHAIDQWFKSKSNELTALRERLDRADGDWRTANAQLLALRKRRDQWFADREARFLVEGRVVDLAGLHEWLASSRDAKSKG